MAGAAPTLQQTAPIRRWLLERVAYYLERPVDEVDPDGAAGRVRDGLGVGA